MAGYLLSKAQFIDARKPKEDAAVLVEARNNRNTGVPSQGITVFLSHKHDEVAVLEDVICMLKNLGVFVYVDWLDEGMPKNTNGYTAHRIKQKIKDCKKFILLATEGAIASKWCNWELGYGDAQKYLNNIAIMPITEKRRDGFSGSEYLQIYPVVKTDYEYIVTGCYVEFKGERKSLIEWLQQ